ncbi:MAG: phosphatase PAP2 family protein [Solirubrobacterales bacterium]|nr:phosphatase PAP2 family protein [Solirubrobacterales bacterium]
MEAGARSKSHGRGDNQNRWAVPLLDARRGGPAERFAGRLDGRHPAAVFFAAVVAGFVVLGLLSIALGLLVTDVLLHTGGLARTDDSVVKSLVAERTPFLTDASEVGSTLGGAPLLPILAGAVGLVFALLRKWRVAAFAAFALAVESATYRVTSLAVPRERPEVKRLEDLPADASFPSGHTAASIAVYVGLVLLITSRFHTRAVRILAWAVAILVPVFVAAARMYRGMHHPLDVAGGLVVGIGALLVLLFACRAAGVARDARSPQKTKLAPSSRAQPVA